MGVDAPAMHCSS